MGAKANTKPDPTTAPRSAHGTPGAHGTCGAKTKHGGKCGRPAGWGTGHGGVGRCKFHLGTSPSHELSGVVELARREMAVMGQPLNIEPHEAILQCIRIAAGEVRYCSDQIAELTVEQAAGPVETSVEKSGDSYSSEERKGPPALNIWILARRDAMDRLVTYAATALKAGVEERKVKVAERAGEMMADLIRGVLTDLGIPLEDPKTREIVVRRLRLIEGGQAG
jgi:hypothetical protein